MKVQYFLLKLSQAQFFKKYHFHWPFIENVTALIEICHFLEGVLSPSVEKTVKQEPVPYTHEEFFLL